MPGTTVVWKFDPTTPSEIEEPIKAKMHAEAERLAGPDFRAFISQVNDANDGTLTTFRTWPDLATAESWKEFVLSEGALSAEVHLNE